MSPYEYLYSYNKIGGIYMADKINKGVGLVLCGGGGKGAYQVGVLKALKENGLLNEVTAISGASIGAINAVLYAMDDVELMYKAWDDMDMRTLFDIDLELFVEKNILFSRDETLKLISKYMDFEKLLGSNIDIYASICKIVTGETELKPEYRKLSDYDIDTAKKILLASTALPLIYEAVEIDGSYYRDGGICDNTPIKPLYDAGIRQFIVICMNQNKVINTDKWKDAEFITITPSKDLGQLVDGTLNFHEKAIDFREMLGYKDGLRAIKTKFEKDDIYIKMEQALALNDYNEIIMQMRVDRTYNDVGSRINSNIEKFNKLAEKYDII